MSNSMTPETDAMIETDAHRIEEYSAPLTAYRRMCELARTLERERDEWRKKAVDLHACHKNALEDIEAEIQARDKAHEQLASERALADRLAWTLGTYDGGSSSKSYTAWKEARNGS